MQYKFMKKTNKGFTLIELLSAIGIFILLCLLSFTLVRQVIQRARMATAKGEISQISAVLEMEKQDTGTYPVFLTDLTRDKTNPPSEQQQGWQGPYINSIPLDPWGNPYFYQIPPTTLFNSPPLPRTSGPPEEDTYSFSAQTDTGILEVENYGITSADIYLNGIEIVSPSEFKKHPNPQIIQANVNLSGQNTVYVRIQSKPGEEIYISISGYMPTSQYFILGSYGADGKQWPLPTQAFNANADIIWQSNVYPNFLIYSQPYYNYPNYP